MAQAERLERILALVLLQGIKGASQRDKIVQLNLAGFSNLEVADLLQTTTAVVAQSLHAVRKATEAAKKRRTAGKSVSRRR